MYQTRMPQFIVNYDGIDYPYATWSDALDKAKSLINDISEQPWCLSYLSLLRTHSQDLCEKSGSIPLYRIIKKDATDVILVLYVA